MLERLASKAEKAKDYDPFDELWIVLYQNTFVPNPDAKLVLDILRESLTQEIKDAFDWTIVLSRIRSLPYSVVRRGHRL